MKFDKNIPYNSLPKLPPKIDFDDVELLKLVNKANNSIYELKGVANILPNKVVIFSPLAVREAVASSGVENINTTVSDALKAEVIFKESELVGAEKEVLNYKNALTNGFDIFLKKGFIATNDIIKIQAVLEPNKKGIRSIPDVAIKNSKTGETIYTPPAGKEIILDKLKNFDNYFNNQKNFDEIDPLIRVAILHYQFEAIHPFLDGNGRTGRILMVLYLVMVGRLDFPILFISKYILETRDQYYELLRKVTIENNWLDFVKYIITGIEKQSRETGDKILEIKKLIERQKQIGTEKELAILTDVKMIDYLFASPFYTQKTMAKYLKIHRNTASRYFAELEKNGILKKFKHKKEKIYYNKKFLNLLSY